MSDELSSTSHYPLVFVNANEEIVRIQADGQVIVDPKWSTDEAAQKFWEAVRRYQTLTCKHCGKQQ